MSRPRIELSDAQVTQIAALAQYLSKGQIADFLGIARNTFDAILERDPVVFEHYKKGRATAIHTVAKGLVQQAIEGNTTAAIFYLKTQAGWRETEDNDADSEAKPVNIVVEVQDGRKTEVKHTSG